MCHDLEALELDQISIFTHPQDIGSRAPFLAARDMHAAGRAANLRYSISLTDSDTDTKWILFMILVKAYTEYSFLQHLYLFLYGFTSQRKLFSSSRAPFAHPSSFGSKVRVGFSYLPATAALRSTTASRRR